MISPCSAAFSADFQPYRKDPNVLEQQDNHRSLQYVTLENSLVPAFREPVSKRTGKYSGNMSSSADEEEEYGSLSGKSVDAATLQATATERLDN